MYFLIHKRYRSYRHYFYSVVHKAPSDLVTEIQNKNIKWQRRKYITVMRHLTYQENGVFVYHQNRKIYKKEELQISSIKILSKKVMGRNGSKWIANFVVIYWHTDAVEEANYWMNTPKHSLILRLPRIWYRIERNLKAILFNQQKNKNCYHFYQNPESIFLWN